MQGPDEIDGDGWRLALPPPARRELRQFRVAVMYSDPASEVDQAVQDRLQILTDFLGRRRVKLSDRARPDIDTAEIHGVYVHLLRAATSGRQTDQEFQANLETARRLPPGDESYFSRMMRANTMSHRDWLAWNERRHQLRLRWAEFFKEWDLLLCPAAASAAFPHDHAGERHQRTIEVNGQRVPTTRPALLGGLSRGGLPAGDGPRRAA